MNKIFEFTNRNRYKEMKSMDRKQMEYAIDKEKQKSFNEGYRVGNEASVKPSEIAVAISNIKGIGQKKREEIMQNLMKIYEERKKGAEDASNS